MNRPILGGLLIAIGILVIGVGALLNVANLSDELPRCSVGGCAESALQYYWTVAEASTLIIVLGFVALGVGGWLVMKSKNS